MSRAKKSDESKVRGYLLWIIGLTVVGLSVTIITVVSIILGFNELKYLVLPLAIRGTVIAAWLIGIVHLVVCSIALRIRTRRTLETVITIVLALSVLSCIMMTAAGIDLARVFTSPATFAESLGDAFNKLIANSRLTPKGLQGVSAETILGTLSRVGMSLAIMQLISFLPFPYNVIIFFIYYKFFTVLLFCLIPLSLSLAAVFIAYFARTELQNKLNKNVLLTTDESSCDESEPLVAAHHRTQTEKRLARPTAIYPAFSRIPSRDTVYQAV